MQYNIHVIFLQIFLQIFMFLQILLVGHESCVSTLGCFQSYLVMKTYLPHNLGHICRHYQETLNHR